MTDERRTDSGIEIAARLHRRGSGAARLRPRARPGRRPAALPFTRGIYPTMYRGRLWTMRQYAGMATARRDERPLPLPARSGPDRPVRRLRPADADGPRLGPSPRRGRGGQDRRGDRLAATTWRRLFDAIPLDRVSTSMTINATAPILLLLYELVAEEQGVAADADQRHRAERHPQGVRGARHLHLPAGAVDAADHRPVRLLRRAHPALEHDLDQRLPHARGRLDGRPGDRVHAGRRDRLRAGRRSTPAWRWTTSRRGSRSSSRAT